jgi:hypothetical protein
MSIEDRQRLGEAWSANTVGSTTEHVSVVLPSFSLGETVVSHYATRLAALEHRYLLASLMLHRIETCEMVFLACERPDDVVLEYYLSLVAPELRESVRRRLRIVTVEDTSGRAVAAKLLDQPAVLDELHSYLDGRVAMLEPWNVTADEVGLARKLGIPVNGTSPDLWPLGFKSAGRRIFARAGVPVPLGFEDVRDLAEARSAIERIRAEHPEAAGVVIKHDNSGAGDGNHVIRFDSVPEVDTDLAAIPAWFVHDLEEGGVVEELIAGDGFSSPSVQVDITPYGDVQVLTTHEQVLGGESGQVYMGCRFPADPGYAAELARHGEAVGRVLAKEGAVGRFGVDFVAVRDGSQWRIYALEINLRRGGTTHPFCVLRHLAPGRYDGPSGTWVAQDGTPRVYRSTDNLVDPSWHGLEPAAVIEGVRAAGLDWDRETRTGVVLHMLSGLAIDGRMGLTAVGRTDAEAERLFEATRATVQLRASAGAS